ncbi:hypothetical protein EZS27_028777 [termite gut metagenome]|uniref:Uncharacterized protein n=1 Tax=termite gut metagenome TaxID=433724 RepID=A0A5J4QI34_9ZZZZ
MELPEFSKDGGYLTVHKISDIKNELGSPQDDYNNYFTARMLLLLESKPIYNEELHTSCLNQVIRPYYVDFHDHAESFKPVFLANDIIRFWKTLCLNYEHKRRKKSSNPDKDEAYNKNVYHSKNLKLQFSRKLTCFSFILQLASRNGSIDEKQILEISKQIPLERIINLKLEFPKAISQINKISELYNWFLEKTQIPSEEMLQWLSDKKLRNEAFEKGREFGDDIFNLLEIVDNQKILRKLLI